MGLISISVIKFLFIGLYLIQGTLRKWYVNNSLILKLYLHIADLPPVIEDTGAKMLQVTADEFLILPSYIILFRFCHHNVWEN